MPIVFSAGIVPVRFRNSKKEFLLLRSYDYWDFPKGGQEPGETHLEAAIRETKEESGLEDLDFSWGRIFIDTAPYKTKSKEKKVKKITRYYIAKVNSGKVKLIENPESGIVEHEDFIWTTFKDAQELTLHPRIVKVLNWAEEITKNVSN